MKSFQLEMLVEPFEEDQPGPHVLASVAAIEDVGLDIEMGPFASTAEGEMAEVLDAVHAALTAGFSEGAERVSLTVTRT